LLLLDLCLLLFGVRGVPSAVRAGWQFAIQCVFPIQCVGLALKLISVLP
jgi:hypothetical protein